MRECAHARTHGRTLACAHTNVMHALGMASRAQGMFHCLLCVAVFRARAAEVWGNCVLVLGTPLPVIVSTTTNSCATPCWCYSICERLNFWRFRRLSHVNASTILSN